MTMTKPWWETRWFVLAAALASLIPLLWPAMPPVTDLPGHIGRYRILADAGHGPLSQYFAVHWAVIGNLGVDLLVLALHPLLDVEPAARLVVTLIPLATVLAMLWLAYEVHGRIPPAAPFALALAYCWPFQLGFVNFCLSVALVLAGAALWLRLARRRPAWVRVCLFVPIACIVWVCHSFGWAMLGLFVFGIEWRWRVDGRARWWRAAILAGAMCAPMALPMALAAAGIGGGQAPAGSTGDWFNMTAKLQWALSLLRDRWKAWDVASALAIYLTLWWALRTKGVRFAPLLATPALLGLAVFFLAPRVYQGGAYVDMRILPYSLALALLAIRVEPAEGAREHRLAMLGGLFLAAQTITTTTAFLLFSQGQAAALKALDHLPRGGATLVLANDPPGWRSSRLIHLGSLAIARRNGFANTQWSIDGQQLIRPVYAAAAPFDRDPTQIVDRTTDGPYYFADYDDTFRRFNRCAFDHVWTIDFPPSRGARYGLPVEWTDGRSTVYRVSPQGCLPKTPLRR